MTKQQAEAIAYRTVLYHATRRNADGTAKRCRVNGRCKVWKTRPQEFSLPVKSGLYEFFCITEINAGEWLTYDCTVKAA